MDIYSVSNYTIAPIRTLEQLTDNKSVIEHYLRKALTKAPEYSLTDILDSVYKGVSLVWLVSEDKDVVGVVVTKVIQYPEFRSFLVHLLGGDGLEDWLHLVSEVEQMGRDLGCTKIEAQGRPAWKKILPDYKSERIILTKDL